MMSILVTSVNKTINPHTQRQAGNLLPQILATAHEQLVQFGPCQVSIRGIAKRLGVSAATIYRYLPSKNAVLNALAVQGFQQLGIAMSQPGATEQGLAHGVRVFLQFAKQNQALYWLMFSASTIGFRGSLDLGKVHTATYEIFSRLVVDSQQLAPATTDVRHAILAAWCYLLGVAAFRIQGIQLFLTEVNDEYCATHICHGLRSALSDVEGLRNEAVES